MRGGFEFLRSFWALALIHQALVAIVFVVPNDPRPVGLSLSKPRRAGLGGVLGLRAEAGSRPACE